MKRKAGPNTIKINAFFKRVASSSQPTENVGEADVQVTNPSPVNASDQDMPDVVNVAEQAEVITTPYQRDPGKRCQIWDLPPDKQDDARHFYISKGAYRPELVEYPFDEKSKHRRRFQKDWYTNFWWLEYSTHNDSAYCLPCFLFSKKPVGRCGSDTFSVKGFRNWKKVNDGKACAFLTHVGKTMPSV